MDVVNLLLGDVGTHEGFTTVDLRDDANVVADVRRLPYEDESVDSVVALDLLEHFPASQTQQVLAEWYRVLKRGGTLTVKVPNLEMLGRWLADGYKVQPAIRNIYGGHRFGPDGAWDCHHTGWTPDTLRAELAQAGFTILHEDRALNFTMKGWKS